MSDNISRADAKMTEEVREALMRLTMCAREECDMCKYKDECGFDFQYKISTDNMNTLSDALLRSKCEVDAKSAEAVHKPDYSYEADMVRRLKESRSADAVPQMEHDREWIIGCIEHDGFIKTDRFDKANQIILDALSGEAETKCVAQIKVDTEEIVRRIKEEYDITDGWIPCSERLPSKDGRYLVCMSWEYNNMEVLKWADGWNCFRCPDGKVSRENEIDGADIVAWMPLPKPYREDGEE